MAYTISKKKGRPHQEYKVRGIKGVTPKGFRFQEIKDHKIIFKRKKKYEK